VSEASVARDLVQRYVHAFQAKDIDGIVALLTDDVVWEMPPFTQWYLGRADVQSFFEADMPGDPGDFHLVPVSANGQPALGVYFRGEAICLQVLTVGDAAISRVTVFSDLSLLSYFGLPPRRAAE
jgi:RNA polymerase sigma-70 factor (ECF subfamily)